MTTQPDMELQPTKEEQKKFNLLVNSFLKKLNAKLAHAKAILGGSGAKGTWLSGNHDIDIFVQYDYKIFSENSFDLSDKLEKSLQQFNIKRLHGSRDYFQITYEGYTFEIVPILKITKAEQAKNITDISPLHAVWVKRNVKDKQQVLLTKQLCKANHLYGAESYISGFSGYVLEILIGQYVTFEKLLKAAAKWKLKQVIDPAGWYKGKDALFYLNSSKIRSPLIVVDPVDKSRNAAAALSEEKFQEFRRLAKNYLKNPSTKFFAEKQVDLIKLQKQGHLITLTIKPKTGKRDVVGTKLLKVFELCKKELSVFTVKEAVWDWDKMYFVLKENKLETYRIREGPPASMKDAVKNFKKKNKNNFLKKGQIYAKIKNKHPKLDDFVKNLIKDKYIKERVVSIRILKP